MFRRDYSSLEAAFGHLGPPGSAGFGLSETLDNLCSANSSFPLFPLSSLAAVALRSYIFQLSLFYYCFSSVISNFQLKTSSRQGNTREKRSTQSIFRCLLWWRITGFQSKTYVRIYVSMNCSIVRIHA